MTRENTNGDTIFHLETVSEQMKEQSIEQKEKQDEQREEESEESKMEKTEMDIGREKVKERLQQVSAKSIKEIKSTRESSVQFKIELKDPCQQPLEAKARPLQYYVG